MRRRRRSRSPPPLRGGFVFVVCFHGLCDVFDVASPVTTGLRAFGAVEGR